MLGVVANIAVFEDADVMRWKIGLSDASVENAAAKILVLFPKLKCRPLGLMLVIFG